MKNIEAYSTQTLVKIYKLKRTCLITRYGGQALDRTGSSPRSVMKRCWCEWPSVRSRRPQQSNNRGFGRIDWDQRTLAGDKWSGAENNKNSKDHFQDGHFSVRDKTVKFKELRSWLFTVQRVRLTARFGKAAMVTYLPNFPLFRLAYNKYPNLKICLAKIKSLFVHQSPECVSHPFQPQLHRPLQHWDQIRINRLWFLLLVIS